MHIPLLAIVAWSGTGKTTLLEQVIPLLKAQEIRVGLIKHTHHDMDVDRPGKDSYRLRKAGAEQVIVASDRRWALMCETPEQPVSLITLVERMDGEQLDVVLVEGFKDEPVAKIVLWRSGLKGELAALLDEKVVAVACDDTTLNLNVPVLNINQPQEVAAFILTWLGKKAHS
ncbi:molybdopterin-guanine dinucleotide biosynthesis protein MobB [Pantoea ananatis]|uniref:molybdopterin-guanine dinucleotide biosynthesis protein MobB n=1 Tax=Pantoea ananas TaxID=553 RepID=UPI0021F7ADE3|nr:molybdopterin-guanine dinucleotide biosynthesis protein MobB [Pantoea ananatis]MCW0318638.1 Molybdopterin-guanine dinucleotide biosynthesis adapter protein [Pantoea ananatis]MCW0336917.1 Molybdopterin-guanine dinucleotide biosynthesis adapter protein [Pantoea ananatis]MCW0384952.1 Molybdopterin-guanine dinucleotide biosynthesis adapter protein [Pantoea ananatis]MCW0409595.1 Molybdopterin-guanine dinucleotide biosynthesis adapter protein [Pantoea ananatis]MCW0429931.1 Molybdopterin-guanine d